MVRMCAIAAICVALANSPNGACPQAPKKMQPKNEEPACWTAVRGVRNPDIANRRLPMLPAELASEKVTRTAAVLRVCVDTRGSVDQAWASVSSGNPKVDAFFRSALLKWKVKPVLKHGVPVRSVGVVAVNWSIQ